MASEDMLPQDWSYSSIGELEKEGVISEIQDGNHGEKHPKSSDYVTSGVPFIMARDIENNRLDLTNCSFLPRSLADSLRIGFAHPGDVLLTHKATMGRVAIVPEGHEYVMLTPQVTYYRIGDRSRLSNVYLKYAFLGPDFQHQLNSDSDQSTRKYIGITDQRRLKIPVPPPNQQQAIAHILSTLDDKIELNRRTNETLEGLAWALFKSWFVDFDPVRAKAEGRDSDLPNRLADLFPNSFKQSELGAIPTGWNALSITEIADVVYGAPFSSSQFNAQGIGKPLIRIRDLASENPGVWTPELHPKGFTVKPGDVVVGMDGEFRAYLWGGVEAWLNQRVCVFIPKRGFSAAFVRNSVMRPLADIEATETATTVIHLGKGDIDQFLTIVPEPHVLETFNRLCHPWYDRMVISRQESHTLAALRDTLLPKLISGELTMPDAERIVGGQM
jgi:type I restriction enzyme, S subunit